VTELSRDKTFIYSLVLALLVHCCVFYSSPDSVVVKRATLAIGQKVQKLRLSLRKSIKPVVKKPIKKKRSKLARKVVPVIKEQTTQVVKKAQSAIMKTDFNALSRYTPKPRYPRRALRKGLQGAVLVQIFIDEQGVPYNSKLLKTSGHKVLDDAALRGALDWRFTPARSGEVAIKSQNNQTFVFSLQNI